jgi:hypothetical protein
MIVEVDNPFSYYFSSQRLTAAMPGSQPTIPSVIILKIPSQQYSQHFILQLIDNLNFLLLPDLDNESGQDLPLLSLQLLLYSITLNYHHLTTQLSRSHYYLSAT